jgi:NAD(P)-dependent dehydrogenase (short-subunit alcohol dehydrogenase family)
MARYSLAGKSVLITGAARGIGAETARQAAAKGAQVALLDMNRELLEETSAQIPGSIWFECDVTNQPSVDAAIAGTVEQFGGIDVVLANAGIGIDGTIEGLPMEIIERTVDVNLTGAIRTVKAALPHVLERRGYICQVSSLAAVLHAVPLTHYAASKAGAEAFGNGLRTEMNGRGVGVGVAYFGLINTDMYAAAMDKPALTEFRDRNLGPAWFRKVYPVSEAAGAIIRGMERRSRRIMWPRQGFTILYLRQFFPRLSERAVRKAGGKEFVKAIGAGVRQDD